MKTQRAKLILLWLLMPALVLITHSYTYAGEVDEEKNYVSDEVLVRFVSGTSETEKDAVRESLGAEKIKVIRSIRVEHWKLPGDITVDEALEVLSNEPCIESAQPNYLYEVQAIPDDTHFDELWFLHNRGQEVNGVVGEAGADISAPQAWDIETGSHNIVIAVVDTGVAYEHPDLINNVWTNNGEIPGNEIDDDENGYVDDVHGWDFDNDDNDPSDYSKGVEFGGNGHGTHVAGIIASQGDNDIGVSGVMWQAQIMPLQAFDVIQSKFPTLNVIAAIEYAVDNGAKIINCSFGFDTYDQYVYDVINYADETGVLVIAAAGNSADDNDATPAYPASYDLPNIISVAATNELDELASYSNYGYQTVDVAAPGGNGTISTILSTSPPERITLFFDDFESEMNKWITDGVYESWSIGGNSVLGSNVLMDSVNDYHNNEDSHVGTTMPIEADNCKGICFEFKTVLSLERSYDYLYMQLSADGDIYATVVSFTGFSNGMMRYLLWAPDLTLEQFYLGFEIVTGSSVVYDGVHLDDIKVTGIPWEFTGDECEYKRGTSMAAPIVSGLAGLIWSYKPNLTHLEVKDVILNSVDTLDALDGKVLKGGRVNAYKALIYTENQQDDDPDGDIDDIDEDINTNSPTPSSVNHSGDGGGSGCFIATAAYGSSMADDVVALKEFRDNILLKNSVGRSFVRFYYEVSPPLADYIQGHESLKTVVRVGLMPLVAISYCALRFGPTVTLSMLVVLLTIPIFLVSCCQKRVRRYRVNSSPAT